MTSGHSPLTDDNQRIWEAGAQHFVDRRVERILALLPERGASSRFLDIGCLDGTLTRLYANRVGSSDVARSRGIPSM